MISELDISYYLQYEILGIEFSPETLLGNSVQIHRLITFLKTQTKAQPNVNHLLKVPKRFSSMCDIDQIKRVGVREGRGSEGQEYRDFSLCKCFQVTEEES